MEYSGNSLTNNVSHSLGASPRSDNDALKIWNRCGYPTYVYELIQLQQACTGEGVFMSLRCNAAQTTTYMRSVSSSTFTPTNALQLKLVELMLLICLEL